MLFGSIMGGVSGGLSVVQGLGGIKTTGKIADINRNIANMQYEYNKKEIDRAFNMNLKSVLREQASEKLGAMKEAKTLISNINLNTGNNKNVDNESFEYDIKDKTKKEIADNMLFMMDNHSIGRDELLNNKTAQGYNLELNYMNALNRIDKTESEMINKYTSMVLSGLMKMGNSYFDWRRYNTQAESETIDEKEGK